MKRKPLLLLSLVALGLSLGLGLPVPAHAGRGGNFEMPVQGAVFDPDTQQVVQVGGDAKVHINFDGPGGGCLHAVIHWNDLSGRAINTGVQYDGRGFSEYEQSVNPNQFAVTFPVTFNLMEDRPGGGCIHVYAQVSIEGANGAIQVQIVLQPQGSD